MGKVISRVFLPRESRFFRKAAYYKTVGLLTLVMLSLVPMSLAEWEFDAGTAITPVTITDPVANEVWLKGSLHTLTCTNNSDMDRYREKGSSDPWNGCEDSVTVYWTADDGVFLDNNRFGKTVQYACLYTAKDVLIRAYADDDYASRGNSAVVDEVARVDSKTVKVVGLEVHEVGFGNDNELYRTPTTFGGWGNGTIKIEDPVYKMDDSQAEKDAKNHVCYTRDTGFQLRKVKCRTPIALTEEASFDVRATLGSGAWNFKRFTIQAGNRESGEDTLNSSIKTGLSIYNGSMTLAWQYRTDGTTPVQNLNSTTHRLYVTFGVPAPGECESTVKRIDHVCATAAGMPSNPNVSDIKEVADAIHGTFPVHGGYAQPQVDDWRLMYTTTPQYYGACNYQAKFMIRKLNLIGIGGAVPYLTFATPNTAQPPADVLVPHSKTTENPQKTWWLKFDFDNNGNIDNNFEGSLSLELESSHHFYAAWPKLSASTTLQLLRDVPGAQKWVTTTNGLFWGATAEIDPTSVPKP